MKPAIDWATTSGRPYEKQRLKNMLLVRFPFMALLIIAAFCIISGCAPQVNKPRNWVNEPQIKNSQYFTGDGAALPIRSWLPEKTPAKAVLVALHGFNDYSNAFSFPADYLSRHGIACYAYDQRGFGNAPERGLWAGIDTYAADLTGFTKELRKLYPDTPLYILGESMGGAITIVAMTGNNPPDADGAILVAPAVWARKTMPWYQRWLLAVASNTVPWLELSGKGLGVIPSDNIEMRKTLGRDPLVIKATRVDTLYGLSNLMDEALARADKLHIPALVQYGKKDQVIPKEPTFLMLEKVPSTTRKAFYDQGYHMLLRDLQREKPLADIAAWVADHNQPLPYGKEQWN